MCGWFHYFWVVAGQSIVAGRDSSPHRRQEAEIAGAEPRTRSAPQKLPPIGLHLLYSTSLQLTSPNYDESISGLVRDSVGALIVTSPKPISWKPSLLTQDTSQWHHPWTALASGLHSRLFYKSQNTGRQWNARVCAEHWGLW